MVIVAFYKVDTFNRESFDCCLHIDAFKELLELDSEDVRFYAVDFGYHEIPQGCPLRSADELEEDYNNEELDGGWWCKTLVIPTDDVNEILGTDIVA